MISFKQKAQVLAFAAALLRCRVAAYASDPWIPRFLQVTDSCGSCADDCCLPACPDSGSGGFCMCGSCDAGSCSYDQNAGNVPQTLFVQPSDFVACEYLFVKFNVQGGGKNACGPYVLGPGIPGTTKTFGTTDEYAFVISVGVGTLLQGSPSCKDNTNLNPEVKVACSGDKDTAPEDSDYFAIHNSCSVDLRYGQKFGSDGNSVAIAGACSGEKQTGDCGYDTGGCCSTSSAAGPTPTTPRPTPSPSPNPTSEPTHQPTSEPTREPTSQPTSDPTRGPTHQPTSEPTSEPTHQPTSEPTREPTHQPTSEPTSNPTREPTHQPTSEPTSEPTSSPTSSPTRVPTSQPTSEPTSNPTRVPTSQPTSNPTREPTSQPTSKPSASPSFDPTSEPTPSPSVNPSVQPSPSPSYEPSPSPSSDPTSEPTPSPSVNPSVQPSPSPSYEPSASPTAPVCPDSVTAAPTPTDDAAYPCICGSCDRSSCSETSCNNGEAPFCGTNTGCSYVKDSTPPVEISLAFVNDDITRDHFSCIQVKLQNGCIVDVPLADDDLFIINKDQCNNVNNGNVKLNPNIVIKKIGYAGCNDMVDLPGTGTEIHTSCSTPVYAGQRYTVANSQLFITAFCNAGPGQSTVCIGNFPAERIDCSGSTVASTSVVEQAETTMMEDVMKISDFQSVLEDEDSYNDNASVKSKVSASILGVIMTLGWYQRQWN